MAVADNQSGQDAMTAIQASKKALRRHIFQALGQITARAVEQQSSKAVGTLLRLEQYKRATSISIYLSIEGKEIETAQIIEDALQAQKQVFVPYLHSVAIEGISRTSVMDMLALNSMEDLESFERDKWGIPSVPADTVGDRKNCFGGTGIKRSDPDHKVGGGGLDLIVVPGMAFDRGLGRLGHGKGYYDRLLSRCQEYVGLGVMDKMPFLVALALEEQVLSEGESVPRSDNDWLIDQLVVGDGSVL